MILDRRINVKTCQERVREGLVIVDWLPITRIIYKRKDEEGKKRRAQGGPIGPRSLTPAAITPES